MSALAVGCAAAAAALLVAVARRPRTYRPIDPSLFNTAGDTWINLGLWGPGQGDDYAAACRALAAALADAAALGPGADVVDAGCGCGDQLVYWLRERGVRSVAGVNICASEVALGRQRLRAEQLPESAARVLCASATALPLEPGSASHVLALDAAYHFDPRTAFFSEAARVLRPGGALALADICVAAGQGAARRLAARVVCALCGIPAANVYCSDEYAARLRRAGFGDVRVRVVTDRVFAGFAAHLGRKEDPAAFVRVSRALFSLLGSWGLLEYVIASGRREGSVSAEADERGA